MPDERSAILGRIAAELGGPDRIAALEKLAPGPCLRISAVDPTGVRIAIVDGGLVRWTEKLLSDGAERLVVSGFGPDLLVYRYRA